MNPEIILVTIPKCPTCGQTHTYEVDYCKLDKYERLFRCPVAEKIFYATVQSKEKYLRNAEVVELK